MKHVSWKALCALFSLSVSFMITLLSLPTLFFLSFSHSLFPFLSRCHLLLSPSPISPLLSLPPDFRWVHRLPKRPTTHPQLSLIELRSLRTLALRFNLFWPERRACTPSLYHYNGGAGRRHRGSRDVLDPERHRCPNAPQQRASNVLRGYGNGVEGWLRFQ